MTLDLGFDHWYGVCRGMIPSSHRGWCTRMLKLTFFEEFVGDDPVVNYMGLCAGEHRSGYINRKTDITAVYPFQVDGLTLADIQDILLNSDVGLRPYEGTGDT